MAEERIIAINAEVEYVYLGVDTANKKKCCKIGEYFNTAVNDCNEIPILFCEKSSDGVTCT